MSWFVLKAGRRERKAVELLVADAMEHYLPTHIVAEERHGKRQLVERPLISNMLLVNAPYEKVNAFVRKNDFIHFAFRRTDTGYAILEVPDDEVQAFRQAVEEMADDLRYYVPEDIFIKRGTRVRIVGGPLNGKEGVILRDKAEGRPEFVISFAFLGALATHISPEYIQIL